MDNSTLVNQSLTPGLTSIGGQQAGASVSSAASTKAAGGGAGAGIIAGSVISGLTDIATSFINAQRVKNTYKFNAAMLELQGRMVRLQANIEIKNIRKRAQELFSTQKALYAKSGVDPFSGSPASVMMNSLKESELDAIYEDITATYNVGAYTTEAGLNRMYGKQAMQNAGMSSIKTILNIGTDFLKR